MASPTIAAHDRRAMAIACASAAMAALPLLYLLAQAPWAPPLAALRLPAIVLLFLIAGLRLIAVAALPARALAILVFPLIGILALALPPLPALLLLVLALLGQAHAIGRAVERGELPDRFGTWCGIAASAAVAVLLAAVVGAAT